jgi:FkbM family methyltransferase
LVAHRSRQFRKLIRLLPVAAYRRGLRFGVAASIEHESIVRLTAINTLIDIGANVGQFTLLTKHLHKDVKVFAFEPLERPALRFQKLFADDKNVILYRYAIGPQSDSTTIFLGHTDGGSSLLPHSEASEGHGTQSVQSRRLDSLLTISQLVHPVFMKLDVQGAELIALQTCGELLEQIDHIFAEVAFDTFYVGQVQANELVKYLQDHGFRLSRLSNPILNEEGRCMGADFLFSR